MTKASEVLTLIEAQAAPNEIEMQVEILSFIRSQLVQVKAGVDQLGDFHAKRGSKDMLSDEALKLKKEIAQLIDSFAGATVND